MATFARTQCEVGLRTVARSPLQPSEGWPANRSSLTVAGERRLVEAAGVGPAKTDRRSGLRDGTTGASPITKRQNFSESLEQLQIARDKCFLLASRPSLQLALAGEREIRFSKASEYTRETGR